MPNAPQDDWRRTGQERYLRGQPFVRRPYEAPRLECDHDHCAFCWSKFGTTRDAELREGFRTLDRMHWVCPDCWSDFGEEFDFRLHQD
jgi:hypothetical protein